MNLPFICKPTSNRSRFLLGGSTTAWKSSSSTTLKRKRTSWISLLRKFGKKWLRLAGLGKQQKSSLPTSKKDCSNKRRIYRKMNNPTALYLRHADRPQRRKARLSTASFLARWSTMTGSTQPRTRVLPRNRPTSKPKKAIPTTKSTVRGRGNDLWSELANNLSRSPLSKKRKA